MTGVLASWVCSAFKVVEDVTDGLEHAFDAFLTLFHDAPQPGGAPKTNLGKKLVRISEPPLPLPPKPRL